MKSSKLLESSADDFETEPSRRTQKRVLRERNTNCEQAKPSTVKPIKSAELKSSKKSSKFNATSVKQKHAAADNPELPNFSDFENYSLVISDSLPLENVVNTATPDVDMPSSVANDNSNNITAFTSTPHVRTGTSGDLRKRLLVRLSSREAARSSQGDKPRSDENSTSCEQRDISTSAIAVTAPQMTVLDASSVCFDASVDGVIDVSGDVKRSSDNLAGTQLSSSAPSPIFLSCRSLFHYSVASCSVLFHVLNPKISCPVLLCCLENYFCWFA